MSSRIICLPVDPDGQLGHSWGRAHTLAVAHVTDGAITDWRTEEVRWDIAHDEGTEGSHHARVARFIRSHEITVVVADHMGAGMQNMLSKLGVSVYLGASGAARQAVLAANQLQDES